MFAQHIPLPTQQPSQPAWQRLPAGGSRLARSAVPDGRQAVAVQAEGKQPELAQPAGERHLQVAHGL